MLTPPAVGSKASVLVTDRSADAPTVVVAVPLSLPGVGSAVAEETVAVLLSTEPAAVPGATATVRVNTALPAGSEANEHDTVPPAPTAGVMHDQPPGDDSETNAVPAGSVSERLTVAALLGPALVTVIV